MLLKKPNPEDYPRILHLLDRAFAPSVSESALVKNLHDQGSLSFDLVLESGCRILAYICYSAAYGPGKIKIGCHLAPLAVLPGHQRRGLGARLVKESLGQLGNTLPVYVLGEREYYGKFGFRLDKTQKCQFDPEGRHFMVLLNGPRAAPESPVRRRVFSLKADSFHDSATLF